MKIIAGSSNPDLAIKLAASLGFEWLQVELIRFSDGELKVKVPDFIDKEVILVQSTSTPVNDNLIELLLISDVVKHMGAEKIIAVIPYFGYARQGKADHENSSIAANMVVKIIEASGITAIITLDLHSDELENSFSIPVKNLKTDDVFLPVIRQQADLQNQNIVIVSPDAGGSERAGRYASLLGSKLAVIDKIRLAGRCTISSFEGNVIGKHCIIIDDMIAEANTICLATGFLLSKGALSVTACVTHGVFSSSAIKKIEDSSLLRLYITDSISQQQLPDKISVLPVHRLLANSI